MQCFTEYHCRAAVPRVVLNTCTAPRLPVQPFGTTHNTRCVSARRRVLHHLQHATITGRRHEVRPDGVGVLRHAVCVPTAGTGIDQLGVD